MQYRSGKELRELFLSYFEEKGSKRYPSFSLVPDDPTLLFTIAGMVPFKPYFLGLKTPDVKRAATAQKCVRTNDIENVGRTARHHTFFEMLGDFSFGDYFKNEIIPWSWKFLTERIGLDPDRLYVTIYLDDDEAYGIWRYGIGLAEDHIVRLGADDNFWAVGPIGPCGPCSEIIYDQGAKYACGKPTCGVGCDCDRYLELWNLVFMQYNRDAEGKLTPLPNNNIDTGMGLERLASVVQMTRTDFETDLFQPIIRKVCAISGTVYGSSLKSDIAVRVISDHLRAAAFMIADGILPVNDGSGYVLRRLIRRSVRYGRLLGIDRPFLTELLPSVRESVGDVYTELSEQASAIEQILRTEEVRFSRTLTQGSELLESAIKKLGSLENRILPGELAFVLYDTYGFPLELTQEMCQELSVTVDTQGFERAMKDQRERARASSKQVGSVMAKTVYTELADKFGNSDFCGYIATECYAKVNALIVGDAEVTEITEGREAGVILTDTPFYGEKGGQVGDKGTLTGDGFVFEVEDTVYPVTGLIVHKGRLTSGTLKTGAHVKAEIDVERRRNIQRHHTATHLLHAALCKVLGKHIRQAGSLVTPTFLRFDFNHFAPMTINEIHQVEHIVYEQVLKNIPVNTEIMCIEEAKKSGAKALFDEKYGDEVRVLSIGDFSAELCGGTHVKSTGEIGLLKIVREEGTGSGIRRINAVVGIDGLDIFERFSRVIGDLTAILGEDLDSLGERAEDILNEKKILERRNRELQVKVALVGVENKITPKANVHGVDLIVEKFDDITSALLRQVGDRIKQKFPVTAILLASRGEGKYVTLTSMATNEAVSRGAHAGNLLKAVISELGGKGGGNAALAQGVAKNPDKIDAVFAKVPEKFKAIIQGK